MSCDIYNIGAGGVSLGGGDRKTLTPAGNYVLNCDIHHFNRWERSYRGAVNIDGVGNRVAHCRIHDSPVIALLLHGNDHVVEFNELHDVSLQANEMSVFYMGRDPSERGNIFRNNFMHHTGNGDIWSVGVNDGACGHTIGFNGGHDSVVSNNIIIDSRAAVSPSAMDNASWSAFVKEPLQVVRLRKAINVLQPPYVSHSAPFFVVL